MEEYHFTTTKTARYHFLGNRDEQPDDVWFMLHGYGQLTAYFALHFVPFEKPGRWIVVPEGLHRFYLDGTSGRVGASWMTKEDREVDIADYISYLNGLLDSLNLPANVQLNMLGFSQGTATACRWFAQSGREVKNLVLYAGVFPPDFDLKNLRQMWPSTKVTMCFGDQDKFATEERITTELGGIRELLPDMQVIRFSGGHKLYGEVLEKLL